MQHSQDGSDRAREAGDTGVHGACLPVIKLELSYLTLYNGECEETRWSFA